MAGDARRIGIYGFGAAAHLIAQVAIHQGREVLAFTRPGDLASRDFALRLGCAWAGDSIAPSPEPLDIPPPEQPWEPRPYDPRAHIARLAISATAPRMKPPRASGV